MNIKNEQKKQKAIQLMQKLDIYAPYIRGFREENQVCFFESFGGFRINENSELAQKIKAFEKEYHVLVYAVTHEYTNFGECYDFLYIPDYKSDWKYILMPQKTMFYVSAYVWNKSDDMCSEFGTIGIRSFGGGIKRVM